MEWASDEAMPHEHQCDLRVVLSLSSVEYASASYL